MNYSGAPTQLTMSTGTKHGAELTMKYERGTGRLKQATTKARKDGVLTPQADLKYGYDAAGNMLSIEDTPDGGQHEKQCFAYDHVQRLTDAWASDTTAQDCSALPGATTTLDGPAPYWSSYTYDAAGSRQQETVHDVDGDEDLLRKYIYPEGKQHKTLTGVETTGPDAQTTTQKYEYDEGGNTITRPGDTAEQHLTWNAEGRLQELDEGGRKTTFVYDAEGNRLLRKQPGTHTLYLPSTDLKLDTTTGVVTATRVYDLGAGAAAIRTKAGVTFTIGDHHGTASIAVEATTGAVNRRRSTPFGGARGTQPAPGTWPGERGFVGGAVDELEGLTHLGAREYDAEIGRFISADPVIDYTQPQQIHGYTYANNNPATLSDPTGEDPYAWGAIFAAIQAALKAYYETSKKVNGSVTDHDVAIRVRVANLRHNYPNAHIKFDYKNQKHGADIVCYDCSPGAVWVWEVKPSGSLADARSESGKHAVKLAETIGYRAKGKGVRVVRGPAGAFNPNEEYALGSNGHDEVMKIWSPEDGVVLYEVHKGDKEPAEGAFKLQRETNKIASQEETKYENENYEFNTYGGLDGGAVKSDPLADVLVIAPIAVGVAACVVYCAGGAIVSGAGAGARWLWRAIRPERTPTLRRGDHDLVG